MAIRLLLISFVLVCVLAQISTANDGSAVSLPSGDGWAYEELRRIPAEEAKQGVAADAEFFYAVANTGVGKYRRSTGERLAQWSCPEGDPLTHLNAGIVYEGLLYCSHSNYPGVPMLSSIEIWDTATLEHVGNHSFGRTDGSLTWIDRRHGRWIACYVHYANRAGEPGRGPEWTRIVEYDDEWRATGGWTFPADLMTYIGGGRGYSASGGALGPGGYLYVTGHDHPELYVLEFPQAGSVLRWIATVPVSAAGQAFDWDPIDPNVIHMIMKSERTIISGRVALP